MEIARDKILSRALTKTAEEWMAIFRDDGNVAAEVFGTTQEALHHPDVVANHDIVTIDDPEVGPVRTIGGIAEFERDSRAHRRTGTQARPETLSRSLRLSPRQRHPPPPPP